jgi:hypothetical protein
LRKIQVVSKYIALSQEGLVPRIECPMDQGLLMVNMDLDDKEYLYCLSCKYQNFIGDDFYRKMNRLVELKQNAN